MSAIEDVVREAWDEPIDQERATQERFVIDSPEKADWALRKLAQIRRRRAEAQAQADRYIQPVMAWLQAEFAKCDRDEQFFLTLLQEYHERTLAADPKAKTIKRPFGTLKLRAAQPAWERDDEALVRWLEERGKADLIKREPRWGELKARFAAQEVAGEVRLVDPETGEIVEGVVGRPQPPRFSVDLPGEEDGHDD